MQSIVNLTSLTINSTIEGVSIDKIIKVKIIPGNEEKNPSNIALKSYNVTYYNDKLLQMQLEFVHPDFVSMEGALDTIMIEITDTS